MKNLRRHFVFAPDSEITIEANPDDITADKLALYRDLGINRLSLGVQSFDEAELRFLQRRHTAAQTKAAIELIRAAGFTNLGLDLMYGLPGQSLDAWTQHPGNGLEFQPRTSLLLSAHPGARDPHGPAGLPPGSSSPWMKKPSGNFSSSPPTSSRPGAISTTKWPISPGKDTGEAVLCLPPQPEVLDPDPLPGAGSGGAFVPGRAALVEFLVRGEILRRP